MEVYQPYSYSRYITPLFRDSKINEILNVASLIDNNEESFKENTEKCADFCIFVVRLGNIHTGNEY